VFALGAATPVVLLTLKQGWVWTDGAPRMLGRTSILRNRRDASEAGEPKNTGRFETTND
jgi:hypothetical protein